jgi:hypothetical protein
MSLKISYPVTVRLWIEEEPELWKRLQEANFDGDRPKSNGTLIRAVLQHVLTHGLVKNQEEPNSMQAGASKKNPFKEVDSRSDLSLIDPQ